MTETPRPRFQRPAGLALLAALALASALCLPSTAQAESAAKEGKLKAAEFRAEFERAFRWGETKRMRELASAHRDLLRPQAEELLEGIFRPEAGKEPREPKETLELARAYAKLASELSEDPYPLRLVGLYGSFSGKERELKSKADGLLRDARSAFERGLYGEASEAGSSALEIYSSLKDPQGQALALHFAGQAARKLARYGEALELHQRALKLAAEAGDRLGRGRALIDLADVHERQKDHPRAVELYKEALEVLRIPEEWREAGRALRQLGDVYVASGELENAYQAYGKALQYAEEGGEPAYVAWYNDYVGYFYRELGDYDKAVQAHRRALAAAERIVDADEKDRALARADNHLGLCLEKKAAQALSAEDSLEARRLYRLALIHEEQALHAARRAEDRWRLGYVVRALAFIGRELGDALEGEAAKAEYERSLARGREALELSREMKEKEWEGLALHHIALTQERMGEVEEGLASFDRALKIWEAIGDLKSMGHAHRLLGYHFFERRGEMEEALGHYGRALEIFERLKASEQVAAVHLSRGAIYEKQGKLESARDSYLASVETLEAMRRKLTTEEHKLAFFERRLDPYEALIALLVKMYRRDSRLEDAAQALLFSERARARTVLDLIQEAAGKIRAGVDEETLGRERKLRADYYAATRELLAERSPEKIDSLRKRLELLELSYSDLLKEMERRYPDYARLKNPKPLSLSEIQKTVLGEGDLLLEYFVGERKTYLFVAGRERLEDVIVLDAGKRELAGKVEALRRPFEEIKETQSLATLEGFDLALAHELYTLLLKPAEGRISSASRLLIVPHGPLYYLPFELLVSRLDARPLPPDVVLGRFETARYALEDLPPIAYAPSASLLDPRLRRSTEAAGGEAALLAFGNPTAAGGDGEAGSMRMRGGESLKLPPLPYAEQEAQEVAGLYGERAKVYLRADATKERFLAEGPGYPLLLLSTHGVFDERHPMYSALVFAPEGGGGGLKLLETHEIFNMRLRAKLVTLSACEVGLGKIRDGEGLLGMSRAFLYAGASSLVVSLWSVYDKSTSQLITGFHKKMRESPGSEAPALKESKLEVMRTRQTTRAGGKVFSYSHPFFWAPFVLVRGP